MAQSLRILHILRAPVGGLFRHVRDLALEQVKWGLEVGVVVDRMSSDGLTDRRLKEIEAHLPLGLHRISMGRAPGVGDLACSYKVARLAGDLGVDVLHGHGAKGGLYARLGGTVAGRSGRCVLRFYTPHGGSLHFFDGSLKGKVYAGAEAFLLRMTDGVIFESAFARGRFASALPLDEVAHRVIANGLQPADFSARVLQPDAADVLFIGELRMLKGVDVLLEALKALDHTGARAVIVGDGPDAERFKALSHRLGLGARVTFAGAMPARDAFGLGRVLAVPSRAESLPYIVLEAAAAGVPVVATNVGGIPEIVEGSDTRLVAAGDVNALACALAHALDDPAASDARAGRLNEAVARRFTVEAMTKSVLTFYRDALLARRPVKKLRFAETR